MWRSLERAANLLGPLLFVGGNKLGPEALVVAAPPSLFFEFLATWAVCDEAESHRLAPSACGRVCSAMHVCALPGRRAGKLCHSA